MIISDLNHVEIVSESAQVEGGFNSYQSGLTIYSDQYIRDNNAIAGAKSDAYGPNTFSKTQTKTTTVAGAYSGSESLSVAGSSRDYYRYQQQFYPANRQQKPLPERQIKKFQRFSIYSVNVKDNYNTVFSL